MSDNATAAFQSEFQNRLATLPLAKYQPGQTVLSAGTRTGLLFILKSGEVSIIKDAVEIAKVDEPGSEFGELSALLGDPHAAEVKAVKPSEFYVADAALIVNDPPSLVYIAT